MEIKEKGSPNSLKAKKKVSRSGAHKIEDVCERNRRKPKEVGEMSAKTKSHHYRKTYDGDQALTNPTPSRHMEIASDTRNVAALAHAHRTQGLGGN